MTIVVTLYALVNAGLSLAGINPLPFTDEQVSASVFGVIGIAGTIYGWWKNQNITSASLAGQQLVDALKKEGVVNGISAALSAAAAVAKTTPKTTTPTSRTWILCRAVTTSDRRRLRTMARQSEPLSGP